MARPTRRTILRASAAAPLARDACELDNLPEREDRAAERSQLREHLRAWMQANGDPRLADWPFKS